MMAARRIAHLLLLIAALGAGLTVHAADTYGVTEVAFTPPPPPGSDETLIYVFRDKGDIAGLRKFAIIDNDTVVAVLTSGSFSHFKVPSGQHEIVVYVSPSPIMHYRVTPAPGKTIYLHCQAGYTSGMFISPIQEEAAKQLMLDAKYTEIERKGVKAKMDYKNYYDSLFK